MRVIGNGVASSTTSSSRPLRALFVETNPIPVKTAASLLGLCSDEMRLPLVPMEGENLRVLQETLDRCAHLLPTPEEV